MRAELFLRRVSKNLTMPFLGVLRQGTVTHWVCSFDVTRIPFETLANVLSATKLRQRI